jgi:catechol 2,3-dioxygenase-like lactoylglutathione lyase family enzyme
MLELDHIGITAHDARAAAQFLAEILGLPPPEPDGPDGDMYRLPLGDSSFLSFSSVVTVPPQHIAFRVDLATLKEVVERLRRKGLQFGNDPEDPTNGQVSDPLGGAGRVYFVDPNGHLFEVVALPNTG